MFTAHYARDPHDPNGVLHAVDSTVGFSEEATAFCGTPARRVTLGDVTAFAGDDPSHECGTCTSMFEERKRTAALFDAGVTE